MEKNEMLKKIQSVKLCLMAHPDNEPDSEFADRIDDLQDIEDSLIEQPVKKETIQDKALRSVVANNITYGLTESAFNANYMKPFPHNIDFKTWKSQQPVREKTLNECKDEVARNSSFAPIISKSWKTLSPHLVQMGLSGDYTRLMNEAAELYASSKSVETQQGWIDVKDRLPENEDQYLVFFTHYGHEIKKIAMFEDSVFENVDAEITHWMTLPPKPTSNK